MIRLRQVIASELVASGGEDKRVHVLRVGTDTPVHVFTCDASVSALAFSHDGKLLGVGTDKHVEVWDLATGERESIAVAAS